MHGFNSSLRPIGAGVLVAGFAMLGGCADPASDGAAATEGPSDAAAAPVPPRRFPAENLDMPGDVIVADPQANATRSAYFGDLHVHTKYSFDAFAFGTVATPDDAYRYAEGEAIEHPAGFEVQLRAPLDFYAVTDHAMFLGGVEAAADPSTPFSKLPHVQQLHDLNAPANRTVDGLVGRVTTFRGFVPETRAGVADGSIDVEMVNQIVRGAWADIIAAAQAHYRPGSFTTFVAYEYTSSSDDRGNLHRNVIFRDADKLPAMPFSRFHSQNPEGLWDWMDTLRAQGIEALAIPHNSNGSNGQMFKMVDWAGDPDNGASVNLSDCSISTGVGAGELKTVWRDPDFDPEHRAFYYARALENPTCRWSTWDAVRAGVPPRPELKPTLQERVWSSAIWYVPDEG